MIHRHRLRVRFGDCDPAGIVYFPRYFDWFHQAMETWFDEGLERPYAEVIASGLGFPAVHTEADYKAPSKLGEDLVVELSVEHVGNASIALDYRVLGADLKATGRTVVCVVRITDQGVEPTRLDGDLRARIEQFSEAP